MKVLLWGTVILYVIMFSSANSSPKNDDNNVPAFIKLGVSIPVSPAALSGATLPVSLQYPGKDGSFRVFKLNSGDYQRELLPPPPVILSMLGGGKK